MKKLLLLILMGMMAAGLTGCPKDDGDIVVIIEDPGYDHGDNGHGDNGHGDNDHKIQPPDSTDESRPDRDSTDKPPRIEKREMSLSAAITLLERDVKRGDLDRLRRHTQALEQAVSAQYERTKNSSRKRTLNLISAKLRGVENTLEDIEGDEVPEEVLMELEAEIGELSSLAERLEG